MSLHIRRPALREPTIPRPKSDTVVPLHAFPRGSCDSHAHIFGALHTHPVLEGCHFVPHECTLKDYVRMLQAIGCERAVLVQPSVYGTDNRLIEEALASKAFALRAVAVVDEDISDRELERMHELGFRGIRINTASATPGLKLHQAHRLALRIGHLGWHLQCFVDLAKLPEAAQIIETLPVPVVIDHFAKVPAAAGIASDLFQALLRLMRHDHCWAKLMGPYFVSQQGPAFADVAPLARALVEVAPDRLVWGTDWPHPSAHEQMPNDGDLANILADWVPDASLRARILVDNPARLYDF